MGDLRRVLGAGSQKGASRRCLERPLGEYDPFGVLPTILDVGNFYRCRLQIPWNFGSVILANLPTRVPLCLLNNAKAPVGMTDLKIKRFFGPSVIFTVTDFKFWRICLVNISVGMVNLSFPYKPIFKGR